MKVLLWIVLAFIVWFVGGVIFKTKRNIDHWKEFDKRIESKSEQ